MKKINKLSFLEVKNFFKKKGIIILKKNELKTKLLYNYKNIYYTFLTSIVVILFFYSAPVIVE
jgi:hypothetical protein